MIVIKNWNLVDYTYEGMLVCGLSEGWDDTGLLDGSVDKVVDDADCVCVVLVDVWLVFCFQSSSKILWSLSYSCFWNIS